MSVCLPSFIRLSVSLRLSAWLRRSSFNCLSVAANASDDDDDDGVDEISTFSSTIDDRISLLIQAVCCIYTAEHERPVLRPLITTKPALHSDSPEVATIYICELHERRMLRGNYQQYTELYNYKQFYRLSILCERVQ